MHLIHQAYKKKHPTHISLLRERLELVGELLVLEGVSFRLLELLRQLAVQV